MVDSVTVTAGLYHASTELRSLSRVRDKLDKINDQWYTVALDRGRASQNCACPPGNYRGEKTMALLTNPMPMLCCVQLADPEHKRAPSADGTPHWMTTVQKQLYSNPMDVRIHTHITFSHVSYIHPHIVTTLNIPNIISDIITYTPNTHSIFKAISHVHLCIVKTIRGLELIPEGLPT